MPKDLSFYVAQLVGAIVMQGAMALQQVETVTEQKDAEIAALQQQLATASVTGPVGVGHWDREAS